MTPRCSVATSAWPAHGARRLAPGQHGAPASPRSAAPVLCSAVGRRARAWCATSSAWPSRTRPPSSLWTRWVLAGGAGGRCCAGAPGGECRPVSVLWTRRVWVRSEAGRTAAVCWAKCGACPHPARIPPASRLPAPSRARRSSVPAPRRWTRSRRRASMPRPARIGARRRSSTAWVEGLGRAGPGPACGAARPAATPPVVDWMPSALAALALYPALLAARRGAPSRSCPQPAHTSRPISQPAPAPKPAARRSACSWSRPPARLLTRLPAPGLLPPLPLPQRGAAHPHGAADADGRLRAVHQRQGAWPASSTRPLQ